MARSVPAQALGPGLDRARRRRRGHPQRAGAAAGYKVVESTGLLELSFQPIGVGASAGSFVVCRDDPVGSQERIVTVTATGIAHVTTTETGDCP